MASKKVILEMDEKIKELVKMIPIALVTVNNRQTKKKLVTALNETNLIYRIKKKSGIWSFIYSGRKVND